MGARTFNIADLFEQAVDRWPDRAYLAALAPGAIPYIGLLGPPGRRDRLLRLPSLNTSRDKGTTEP